MSCFSRICHSASPYPAEAGHAVIEETRTVKKETNKREHQISVVDRRSFLKRACASAALPWLASIGGSKVLAAPSTEPTYSGAVQAMRASVGEQPFAEVLNRLRKTNSDIKSKGLKTIRGVASAGGTFLTGY